MEGIRIALDFRGDRMFLHDLAGSIYSAKLDGTERDHCSSRREISPASLTQKSTQRKIDPVIQQTIHRIAIVGTGVIGASWAAEYLARGFDVVATDPAPNAEANLRKYIDNAWKDLTTIGLSKGASRDRLTFTTDLKKALSKADFVQAERARASRLQDQAIRRYERCDSGGFTHRLEFFRDNTKCSCNQNASTPSGFLSDIHPILPTSFH